jgi:hypothetical protein
MLSPPMAQAPIPTTDASIPDFPIFILRIANSLFRTKNHYPLFPRQRPAAPAIGLGNAMALTLPPLLVFPPAELTILRALRARM